MRWTEHQFNTYEARRRLSGAIPEQIIRHEPVATASREDSNSPRHVVRITSYRRRLLDPDNLSGGCKFFLDGCRHAGLIPDDSPDRITLEVSQHKVKTKQEERTEIEVTNE